MTPAKHWKGWRQSFENEYLRVFDMEVTIGLLWCYSVRDDFRHMWE